MMRWLIIILLSLNASYLLWTLLVSPPGQPGGDVPFIDDRANELALWQSPETDVGGEAGAGPGTETVSTIDEAELCFAFGPFAASLHRDGYARGTGLADAVPVERERQLGVVYRVYMGPYADEAALQEAHTDLRAALDAGDATVESFPVTAGDRANTISLGLFRDPANAASIRARMDALGYVADVSEEPESTIEYWLVIHQGPSDALYGQLPAQFAPAILENLCETIAP